MRKTGLGLDHPFQVLQRLGHVPADLTRGHRLYGHCAKCGRTKVLDVNQLEQRFGPFFTLDEVRARVRCTKCKRRTNELRLVSDRR